MGLRDSDPGIWLAIVVGSYVSESVGVLCHTLVRCGLLIPTSYLRL